MMKTTLSLIVILTAAIGLAQDQAESSRAAAGCGAAGVRFDVKTDSKQHPIATVEPGKAAVYVFEDEKHEAEAFRIAAAVTTRVGLDGKWVGANHGASYFFFATDPGEHHLCTDWQSSLKTYAKLGSAVTFIAESGKSYYFRVAVEELKEHPPGVKLNSIDEAQGQFMISSHSLGSPVAK